MQDYVPDRCIDPPEDPVYEKALESLDDFIIDNLDDAIDAVDLLLKESLNRGRFLLDCDPDDANIEKIIEIRKALTILEDLK